MSAEYKRGLRAARRAVCPDCKAGHEPALIGDHWLHDVGPQRVVVACEAESIILLEREQERRDMDGRLSFR